MVEEELDRLSMHIDMAFCCDVLNGWELEFLTDIQNKIEKYGLKTRLSDRQYYRLDQIFHKSGAYMKTDLGTDRHFQ